MGLDGIIKRRIGSRQIGFVDPGSSGADTPGARDAEPEDLVKYGLIPELIGRLPIVTTLAELTEDQLVDILVKPRNCMVRQYQKLLAMEGIDLSFTDSALREMARLSVDRGTGARGLRAIIERIMLDVMYEAPRHGASKAVRVTKRMVDKQVQFPAADVRMKRIA